MADLATARAAARLITAHLDGDPASRADRDRKAAERRRRSAAMSRDISRDSPPDTAKDRTGKDRQGKDRHRGGEIP